ncbi:MAG: hypothetical protein WCK32_01270 [Chlorobiaceae bacterium]
MKSIGIESLNKFHREAFTVTLVKPKHPMENIFMNARETFRYALLAGILFTAAPCFAAESTESTTSTGTRIKRLEKELSELKDQVKNEQAPAIRNGVPNPAVVSPDSGVNVQLYGFARLDMAYDTAPVYPGNTAIWAKQPLVEGLKDPEWVLAAGATRFGINLTGPDTETVKLTGNIEFDFLAGNTENAMNPRQRHSYLKAYWQASDFSILAGQTWDLVSSLVPFVDDPGIMWGAGNIGARHPQFRVTKGFKTGESSRIELAVAISRSIGETNKNVPPLKDDPNTANTDTGKAASIPTFQGRIGWWAAPIKVKDQPATIAVSGHYGQEDWITDYNKGITTTIELWSGNVELFLPLSDKLTLAGEYFTGTNLDDFWGGIGQGAWTPKDRPGNYIPIAIRSKGGWAAIRYTYSPSTTISMGGGVDDPKPFDRLPDNLGYGPSSYPRTKNRNVFACVTNKLTSNLILGMQLSKWNTDYDYADPTKGNTRGDAVRAQTSLTYKF